MLIGDIIQAIELEAPIALQEPYDNSGLQVGALTDKCTGVLLSVDVTESVVQEAIETGCNLIVSHHPLLFRPLKRLTGSTPTESTIIKAVTSGISIYSSHTCLDNAANGVSKEMARMLGIKKFEVLEPQADILMKLTTFVPNEYAEQVRAALFAAGAGKLENYDSCSYSVHGEGTFRALNGASPFVGEIGRIHTEPETRIELVLPSWKANAVEAALLNSHPYEVPAYEFTRLTNKLRHNGSGIIGTLPQALLPKQLVDTVKHVFGSPIARCSSYPANTMLQRIAMCGGSGSYLIEQAIASGAQAYITSDTKYHDFVDYSDRILIIDIGHFESEQCTKTIFYHLIREIFPNFAVRYSAKDTNPINYM